MVGAGLLAGLVTLLIGVLFLLGSGQAYEDYPNFDPTFEFTLCNKMQGHPDPTLNGTDPCTENLDTNASPDLTTAFVVPLGDLNFAHVVTTNSKDFCIAPDRAATPDYGSCSLPPIPDGEKIGGIFSISTLGLANNPCNNVIPVPFTFFESTTDVTNTTSPLPEGLSDRNEPLARDNDTGVLGDPLKGEPNDRFVKKYPDYFVKLFDPDYNPGGTNGPIPVIEPHARYSGMRVVAGEWIFLSSVIFRPGQLVDPHDDGIDSDDGFQPPHPFSRFTEDKGWATVTVLIPPDPTEFAGRTSAISDVCSELISFSMMLGTGQGASARVLSPSTPGTQLMLGYTMSQRDADQDGIENGFDTCPYNEVTATWTDNNCGYWEDCEGGPWRYDPRVDDDGVPLDDDLDPDDDMIPGRDDNDDGVPDPGTGCDPTPEENTGPTDHDADVFQNTQDNCPLVANPVAPPPGHVDNENSLDYITVARDGGQKTDDIGDVCDNDNDTADGSFLVSAEVEGKCIGVTDGPPTATDADGDGWCSTGTNADKDDNEVAALGPYPAYLKTADSPCPVPLDGSQRYDIDCDGFSEWIETHSGTNGAAKCSADTVPNNEALDAWPTDADDDQDTDIFDILRVQPSFGSAPPSGSFDVRFDFDGDWDVDFFDIFKIKPHFNLSCTDTGGGQGGGGAGSIDLVAVDLDTTGKAGGSTPTLGPVQSSGALGISETLMIDVIADEVPVERGTAAFQFTLNYDPAVVKVSAMSTTVSLIVQDPDSGSSLLLFSDPVPDSDGSFLATLADLAGPAGIDPPPFALNGDSSEAGPGVLMRLTLEGVGSGTSDLTLTGVGIGDDAGDPIPINSIADATVEVIEDADDDGDGVPDTTDNCPAWPNPGQALPPWPVPPNDPDCDGFDDTAEGFVGTLPTVQCASDTTIDNEDPDPWPPDFQDDRDVDIFDVLTIKPYFGSPASGNPYSARHDLQGQNGTVDIFDVLAMKPYFMKGCT